MTDFEERRLFHLTAFLNYLILRKLSVITFGVIMMHSIGCAQYVDTENRNKQVAFNEGESLNQAQSSPPQVTVRYIEFYTLPGDEKLETGPSVDSPSTKRAYIKLERWQETDDPKTSHSPRFDVVCSIDNNGDHSIQESELILLTTIDFVVAPTYLYNGDIDKIISEVNWGSVASMNDVRMTTIPYIAAHKSTVVKIENFDLSDVIKNYDGLEDTLWPWALRVNVNILNREMIRVAQGQAVLPMVPAKHRLRNQ